MLRRPRLPELGTAAVVALVAGCGGGGGNTLAESSKALDHVHSGILSLSVTMTPSGTGHNPFGFELTGPFRLGKPTLARMVYTQIANGHRGSATVVLGRTSGYVESGGHRRPLTNSELQRLRGTARAAAVGGGLKLDEWVTSRHERSCGDAICVDGELDPAKAIAGLTQLQQAVAAPAPAVKEDPSLSSAVQTSRYHLVAAKGDKTPREVTMEIDFHKAVPARLRTVLGSFVGAKLSFRFVLTRPNENVGLG